jgi:hypothetical protein
VSYDADSPDPDPWDLRYLGDAIDLDKQIELRRSAVAAGAATTDLGAVVGELAGGVPLDATRSAAETVVGASIVRAAAGDDDPVDRWHEVFSFRDDGAPWGVVALDQRAERAAVLSTLDDVIRGLRQRFGGVAAARPGNGNGAEVALGGTPDGGTGPTTPAGGGDGSGDGGTTPPTTTPPGGGGPQPTLPPTSPLPTVPRPELPPLLPDPGGEDPDDPPPPGGASDPVADVVEEVVETVEDVPVVGDLVEDLLDDPPDLPGVTTTVPLLGG